MSDPYLSLAEIATAIRGLSDREKSKILARAEYFATTTPYGVEEGKDLVSEAFIRVLEGDRKWERGVPAILFFVGPRGVISNLARDLRNTRGKPVPERRKQIAIDPPEHELSPNPELAMDSRNALEGILADLNSDPLAQRIVRNMLGEATGPISEDDLEKKRKKIHAVFCKHGIKKATRKRKYEMSGPKPKK